MTALTPEQKLAERDKEMIPLVLIRAMFALALFSLVLVAYARLTDRPLVGVPPSGQIVAETVFTFEHFPSGEVQVIGTDGSVLASSRDDRSGFIEVIWRVQDRARMLAAYQGDAPVKVVRFDTGRIAIIDTATQSQVELSGYGADNVAAFASLLP